MGRPPAFQEFTGPRWPGPAPQASPTPLVRRCAPAVSHLGLPPCYAPFPLPRLASGGGGSSSGLGGFPPSLGSDPTRMACAAARGVAPPPALARFLTNSPPPFPARPAPGAHDAWEVPYGSWLCGCWVLPVRACCALGPHAARGTPLPRHLPSRSGGSPLPAPECHALRAHAALQGGPPLHWVWSARRLRPRSIPCPTFRLLWGVVPLILAWHALRWEHKLPYRGVPPFSLSHTARRGR